MQCLTTGLSPSYSYKKHKCRCEVCVADRQKQRDKDKVGNAARSKAWRAKNPEKSRAIAKRWAENNPEKVRDIKLKKYGITGRDYDRMLADQDHRCAICEGADSNDKRGSAFHVDHDHATGKVRGLLCSTCNTGLGKFKDNTDILQKAILYLR